MKHETITTQIEDVSPAIAQEYLLANTNNRPAKDNTISHYASLMRAGQWGLTHQGIAFDVDGVLKDGQQRLNAIVVSKQTVQMMVTRGLPTTFEANGHGTVKTMDVIDCGRNRSTADQMHLSYGVASANFASAACATLAQICCGHTFREKLSTPQAMEIWKIYGAKVEEFHKLCFTFKPAKLSPVVAALAFASHVHKNLTADFAIQLVSGSGLRSNDPAHTLRGWLINGGHRKMFDKGNNSQFRRIGIADVTLNCLHHHKGSEKVSVIKHGAFGREYFVRNQRVNVETVRNLFITALV